MKNIYLQEVWLGKAMKEHAYWHSLPFYKELENGKRLTFYNPVTFFVGENGCGKSTLTEAIAVLAGYNAEGGSKNFNFETRNSTSGLFSELKKAKTGYERDGFFLRAESFYNAASYIDDADSMPASSPPLIGAYGGLSLHEQSHGESFLALVQNRFRGNGLYILDEPEAALSPMRQMTLMAEMNRLVCKGSQFIIATHSPILLTFPHSGIYRLDNGIENTVYEDTEHYRITKGFLNAPQRYLKELFKE